MPQAQPIPKRAPRNLFADEMPPEEEIGFWSKLLPNIGTGLAHAGRSLHNLPHDIASGIDMAGSAIGRSFGAPELQNQNSNIAQYMPSPDTTDYSQVFGLTGEKTPVDQIIQKGIEFAPDILGGMNALRAMKLLPHLTKYGATKKLKKAKELAANREIGTLNVNPELIEDARQFLPDLLQNRNALNASHAGDYKSLFDLQSDVGKISAARRGKIKSLFAPESHLKGEAGLKSRNSLLEAIHENLQSMGHHDVSHLLRKGQEDYRRYMKFRKIRNILGGAGAAYAAPQNPLTDLVKKLWMHGGQ